MAWGIQTEIQEYKDSSGSYADIYFDDPDPAFTLAWRKEFLSGGGCYWVLIAQERPADEVQRSRGQAFAEMSPGLGIGGL